MPYRRRRGRGFGMGAGPQPIVAKAPKTKPNELEKLYRRLATADIAARLVALETAILPWYKTQITAWLAFKALDTAQVKTYDKGCKAEALGNGSSTPEEKEAAYRMAVRQFERLWAADYSLPLIDKAYTSVDAGEVKAKLTSAATDPVAVLNMAYEKVGVRFTWTFKSEQSVDLDTLTVSLPHKAEAELTRDLKSRGAMAFALSQFAEVVKLKSVITNAAGAVTLDVSRLFQSIQEATVQLGTFSQAAAPSKPPRASSGTRSPRSSSAQRTPDNPFYRKWVREAFELCKQGTTHEALKAAVGNHYDELLQRVRKGKMGQSTWTVNDDGTNIQVIV